MRFILLILLVFLLKINAFGQEVESITLRAMEERLERGKDTTYVVNFWATWCLPCRKELPIFEKLAKETTDPKIKIILLSLDIPSKRKAVEQFVTKNKLSNSVYILNDKTPGESLQNIQKGWKGSIPATLIVNTERDLRKFYAEKITYSDLIKILN